MVSFVFSSLYLWNSIPNSRKEVHISKEELRREKVILEEDLEKYEECTKAAYDKQVDSLRKIAPRGEWNTLYRLEDAVEYVKVKKYQPGYYDYWSGYQSEGYYYDDYEKITVKRKVENDTAYPILIKRSIDYQGIDSAYFCEKIRIINLFIELHKRVPTQDATTLMKNNFFYWVTWNKSLKRNHISKIYSWMDNVEGKKIVIGKSNKISDGKRTTLEVFSKLIGQFQTDSISEKRMELVDNTISYFKNNGFKKANANFNIILKTLRSKLADEDLEVALTDYFEGKLFKKNAENPDKEFSKYMNLFTTKIKLREDEKTLLEYSREEKLEQNKNLALYSLLGILQVIIILVLFAIHRSIKDNAK
ncbi:MAG: hypothetical protein RL365_358 [Bacteroidota bacterium]